MFFGYECKNPDHNWSGSIGCWGKLTLVSSVAQVTAINFAMNDSFNRNSLVGCMTREFQEKENLTLSEAQGKAMKLLCETILRNRVKWSLEYRKDAHFSAYEKSWWLRVEGIDDMPKNHLMFLLFSIRSSLGLSAHHVWKELRNRGVKSHRKMILGCQLVLQSNGFKGVALKPQTTGGVIFLSDYTVAEDVETMYRGTKLKGPKDKPWSVGGGYTSGVTCRGVQYAGCSCVKAHSEDRGSRGPVHVEKGTSKKSMRVILGLVSDYNHETAPILDKLADFLKALK